MDRAPALRGCGGLILVGHLPGPYQSPVPPTPRLWTQSRHEIEVRGWVSL